MFLVPMVHEAGHAAIAGFYRWPIFEFRVLHLFPAKTKRWVEATHLRVHPFAASTAPLKPASRSSNPTVQIGAHGIQFQTGRSIMARDGRAGRYSTETVVLSPAATLLPFQS